MILYGNVNNRLGDWADEGAEIAAGVSAGAAAAGSLLLAISGQQRVAEEAKKTNWPLIVVGGVIGGAILLYGGSYIFGKGAGAGARH
ncbi:MAG: hypothetical protein ABIH03_00220 [Pseudomonadota bacterium]